MTVTGRPLSIALLVAALALVATPVPGTTSTAWAQNDKAPAAPTPAQLEQAKKAFLEGKQLFDARKYEPAVEKFKESYRLSRNPLLLYNIAFTLDSLGQKDLALFYYKKFLSDAPADAAQRGEVTPRVAVLEKELAAAPVADIGGDDAGDAELAPAPVKKPKKKKPAAEPVAYTADDFQHQVVEDAPPGRPLDLSAFAPEDSDWMVTLFYRAQGEAKFTAVPMKSRYNELVGRVPARKMTGVSIQYYIEVRSPDSKIVTRIGKPASPNIVYIDPKARPRYYPDLEDDGTIDGGAEASFDGGAAGASGGHVSGGWTDAGSRSFRRAKWIATGSAVGLLGTSLTFYLLAANMSGSLEAEATRANSDRECDADPQPCKSFNDDRKAVELAGQRNELVSNIAFGVGVAATGVAAYFWYKEIKATKQAERAAAAKKVGLDSLVAAPVVGDGFVGGAAALRF